MVTKIHEKLVKGYYSSTSLKEVKKDEPPQTKVRTRSQIKTTIGGYFEKGAESVMIEISEKLVKVTRTGTNGKSKEEVRNMESYDEGVQFLSDEQEWLESQGYVENPSKFKYSFDGVSSKNTVPVYKIPRSVGNN